MVKRSKTPPFHGGNRGSIPLWVTTSRRAFWLAVFLYKNTASLYRLPLLFRKRSRSAHLLACKRARDDSLSLTTFRDFCAYGAYISFWQVDPPRSKVRFAPTYFLSKISHPPTSLLLLFRKKALRVGYSLASALITPFAHYHLVASCACGAYVSFWQLNPPRSKVRFAGIPMSQSEHLKRSDLPHRRKRHIVCADFLCNSNELFKNLMILFLHKNRLLLHLANDYNRLQIYPFHQTPQQVSVFPKALRL